MAVKQRNNSVKKPRGKGKPFQANNPETGERDERINRTGRKTPQNIKELHALIDEILLEDAIDANGNKMQKIRVVINRLIMSRNPAGQIHILDRRFGKVTEKVDLSNSDGSLRPQTMKPSEIAERAAALLKLKEQNESDGN